MLWGQISAEILCDRAVMGRPSYISSFLSFPVSVCHETLVWDIILVKSRRWLIISLWKPLEAPELPNSWTCFLRFNSCVQLFHLNRFKVLIGFIGSQATSTWNTLLNVICWNLVATLKMVCQREMEKTLMNDQKWPFTVVLWWLYREAGTAALVTQTQQTGFKQTTYCLSTIHLTNIRFLQSGLD